MATVQSGGALVTSNEQWLSGSYPRTSMNLYDLTVDYATLWRTQRNLRQVVSFCARNFADLGFKAYERKDDDDRKALSNSPIQDLIYQPNPKLTSYDFKYALLSDYLIYDRYAFLKVRNKQSGNLNLVRIPPEMIRPEGGVITGAERFELLGTSKPVFFNEDEVFYQHGYSPNDNLTGCSPIESLRNVLAEEISSAEWRYQYWKNFSRQSGIIKRPQNARWSPEAKKAFLDQWNSAYGSMGGKVGEVALLEDGMEFEPTSFSPKDSEFVAARQLTTQEVGAAYHVAPVFLGVLDNANFSNVRELHKHLYQDTLGPWCTQVAQKFQQQVMVEFQDIQHNRCYVEFNIAAKLAGSFEERAAILQAAVGGPWMTRNEARALDNRPRLDEGEGLIIPLNVLVGGQASPQDSAPDEPSIEAPKSDIRNKSGFSLKALEERAKDLQNWQKKHVEVLSDYFKRQQSSVMSKIGAGQSVESAWDTKRWDTELRTALAGLSLEMVKAIAAEVAGQYNATFDAAVTEAWTLENARIASENINETTKNQLKGIDPEEDRVSGAKHLFEVAATSRAAQIAVSRVTTLGGFAREEGAKQVGGLEKTWKVTSSRSRHPRLNGETVKVGEKFSNGALYPGDPKLDEDEAAGCECDMRIHPAKG